MFECYRGLLQAPAVDFMKSIMFSVYEKNCTIFHEWSNYKCWLLTDFTSGTTASKRQPIMIKSGNTEGMEGESCFLPQEHTTTLKHTHTHTQWVFWWLYLTSHPSSDSALMVLPNTWSQNSLRNSKKKQKHPKASLSDTFPPARKWNFH